MNPKAIERCSVKYGLTSSGFWQFCSVSLVEVSVAVATSIPGDAVATFATALKKYDGLDPVTSFVASMIIPEWLSLKVRAAARIGR